MAIEYDLLLTDLRRVFFVSAFGPAPKTPLSHPAF